MRCVCVCARARMCVSARYSAQRLRTSTCLPPCLPACPDRRKGAPGLVRANTQTRGGCGGGCPSGLVDGCVADGCVPVSRWWQAVQAAAMSAAKDPAVQQAAFNAAKDNPSLAVRVYPMPHAPCLTPHASRTMPFDLGLTPACLFSWYCVAVRVGLVFLCNKHLSQNQQGLC